MTQITLCMYMQNCNMEIEAVDLQSMGLLRLSLIICIASAFVCVPFWTFLGPSLGLALMILCAGRSLLLQL